jgi:polar amino acid transport system substrate-binding protein
MKRCLCFALTGLLLASTVFISCSQTPGKIRVATDATYPPFTYIDEHTGQLVGFDINLMNLIAEKENLEVEFVKVNFEPLLEGMALGIYDAAISAISITEARQKDMLFSEPYFVTGHVITVFIENNTITGKDSLVGKVVGAETGSTSAADVSEMEGVTAKYYVDLRVAFDDLMNNKIDAVVSDKTIASVYVTNYPDKLKIIGEPFTQENYGIAVAKNKPELLQKINAGLNALKAEGMIEQLTQKWLPPASQ